MDRILKTLLDITTIICAFIGIALFFLMFFDLASHQKKYKELNESFINHTHDQEYHTHDHEHGSMIVQNHRHVGMYGGVNYE